MVEQPESQLTSSVVMVRPMRFHSNPLTAASNVFQGKTDATPEEQQAAAAAEFDALAARLTEAGLKVYVFDDTREPETPDSIFPNNWVTTHPDGTVVLYPMEAPNRRTERRHDIIDALGGELGFDVRRVIDLSHHEENGHFLEGTGSLVLDRVNHVAYACLSSRTHEVVIDDFAKQLGYEAVVFDALDREGLPIYHTNVMMNVGEELAIVCVESIADRQQQRAVLERLEAGGREVVPISFEQVLRMAGNMLELRSVDGERLLAMSDQAHRSLTAEQVARIEASARIVSSPINEIESSAGGSVRCMLAEVHLPARGGAAG